MSLPIEVTLGDLHTVLGRSLVTWEIAAVMWLAAPRISSATWLFGFRRLLPTSDQVSADFVTTPAAPTVPNVLGLYWVPSRMYLPPTSTKGRAPPAYCSRSPDSTAFAACSGSALTVSSSTGRNVRYLLV